MVASGDLVVTPRARALGLEIVMRPPVPVHLRPLLELANFVTVGLLPPAVRRQYGFSWDPARALACAAAPSTSSGSSCPCCREGVRYVRSARRAAA